MTAAPPPAPAAGLALGLAGMCLFAATLPMTRLAVADMPWWQAWSLRGALASVASLCCIVALRVPRPAAHEWGRLAWVVGGVVFGFPVLVTYALETVPAGHGGIVTGLLPLATAVASALLYRDRQRRAFWLAAAAGAAVVCAYSLDLDGNAPRLYWQDLLLAAAVGAAGLGYAAGGSLAVSIGGIAVICWANVVAGVVLVPIGLGALLALDLERLGWASAGALLYMGLVSQFAGFFIWYTGLAKGGVARVSQVMLLMPFVTLLIAAVSLSEALTWRAFGYCLAVLVAVWLSTRLRVARPAT